MMKNLTIQERGGLAIKKKLGSKKKVAEYYRNLQKKGVASRLRKRKNALKRKAK